MQIIKFLIILVFIISFCVTGITCDHLIRDCIIEAFVFAVICGVFGSFLVGFFLDRYK